MGERFRRGGGGGQAGDLPTEMPAYPRRKRKEKDASGGRLAEPPRRWCSREDRDLKRTPHAQRDRGPEGSRSDVHRETEEWKGEPRPTGRSSKEITQGAALGDTEEEERMPCARREIERGHSGRCPRKGGKGGEGASSPEGGGGDLLLHHQKTDSRRSYLASHLVRVSLLLSSPIYLYLPCKIVAWRELTL